MSLTSLDPKALLAVVALAASAASQAGQQSATAPAPLNLPVAKGPYQPTMASLEAYRCPNWFRDAKFGIWAHWGPQAVPMEGDWYARRMYEEGGDAYKLHIERYGHPSKFGYKDIIPLWKAEKWDPDRLMSLYKKAGARYFVSMASHHDNFFLWNSKLHEWNSVNMGPKKDVVAVWKKAAMRQGLKFGVSEHLAASFTWFQPSHGADKSGPMAGVPYDGADPKNQSLYHFPAKPGDTGWMSNDPRYQQQWYDRIKELVDNYHPDLLYSDSGVPFSNEVGLSQIANLYNRSSARAIYTCKQGGDGRWVQDLERGVMPKINPYPWQTDTSIGDWFYNRHWKIRPVSWVIHTLVDVVAKNGNLLLNVVQRPDGSIDADVEEELKALADWNAINGEAIFGSRPWKVYGEGAIRFSGGAFKEDFAYTSNDVRFTTKGGTLYAIALGAPIDGFLRIRSLAKAAGKVRSVQLLGSRYKVEFSQTDEALLVKLPSTVPQAAAYTLKIAGGARLNPVSTALPSPVVNPNQSGSLVLAADLAEVHGDGLTVETKGDASNLGFWDRGTDWASWKVRFPKAGAYRVTASTGGLNTSQFAVVFGSQKLEGVSPATNDWGVFQTVELGEMEVNSAGEKTVELRAADSAAWKAINVRWIRFDPVQRR